MYRRRIINTKAAILFDRVSERDFDDILKLEQYSFNEHDGMNMDDLHEYLGKHGEGFYKISVGSRFAGYILFFLEDGSGYMESIAIDRAFRGQGIAVMAIRFMAGMFREMGVRVVNLHVRGDNSAALSLYEKCGFIRSGTDKDFYGEGSDACIYTLNIG